jgi:hypothetical protein
MAAAVVAVGGGDLCSKFEHRALSSGRKFLQNFWESIGKCAE